MGEEDSTPPPISDFSDLKAKGSGRKVSAAEGSLALLSLELSGHQGRQCCVTEGCGWSSEGSAALESVLRLLG